MAERAETVAVVGAGVIGGSWAALFLAHGYTVLASDPAPGAEERLNAMVEQAWPVLASAGAPREHDPSRLRFTASAAEAAEGAAFIQENGPEDPAVKSVLMAEIDEAADPEIVIASSSSGLQPSVIAAMCPRHPERVLVGHPFNPPHLIPLVEVVPGTATSAAAVDQAMSMYRSVGRRPVHVRHELPGHIGNRLQMALWREAFWLVQSGAVTAADIDAIITSGPGLRWSAVGPFTGLHLSGGDGGITHNLAHMGPAITSWWETLGAPTLDNSLIALLAVQVDDQLDGRSPDDVSLARDRLISEVIAARAAEPDLP